MADQPPKSPPPKWRGATDLVFDAVAGTTELVESTHDLVAETTLAYLSRVQGLGEPARRVDEVRRMITSIATGSVRAGSEAVRQALEWATPLVPDPAHSPAPMRFDQTKDPRLAADALLGVVNGLVGDYLREQANPLDLGMQLRFEDRYFTPDCAAEVLGNESRRIALFVHGLMATELAWTLNSETAWGTPEEHYGRKLRADLGYTPLFARFNSGLHVSENGRALAELLSALHAQTPLDEIVLIGHSLGGLVARSAAHYGSEATGGSWTDHLTHVVTLGTPHLGSVVAQGGQLLTFGLDAMKTPATHVISSLGKRRSAAIKDLRGGYIVDEDWRGKDPDTWVSAPRTEVAFVDDVTYLFLGAHVSDDPHAAVSRALGDLLVRVPSSTNASERSAHIERRVLPGMAHLTLQNDPRVYDEILAVLGGR